MLDARDGTENLARAGEAVSGKIDTAHLRQVALTGFDIQLLGLLAKSGGEYPVPETVTARALLETTRGKGLVEVVERFGERPFVRLTDQGRAVVGQLETMAAQPKIEVVSQ
jgi:hypothetical protein